MKIISKEEYMNISQKLKDSSKKIVLCHGVYDLLHYGHLEHLKEAKNLGDVLIVSVTSAKYVNKGPDRPYYNDKQRTEFLANLEIVDYVLLSDEPTAKGSIATVKPNIFVKGQEFEDENDGVTGNIKEEVQLVKKNGGIVYYTKGEVHSSSKLLNTYFDALPDQVIPIAKELKKKYGTEIMDTIISEVERLKECKVLVIGDIIIDEYIFCKAQGLTGKDTIISTRYEKEEKYLGGAIAVARHVANFSDNVSLFSMMGEENGLYDFINDNICDKIKVNILKDSNFITPMKRRFLKQHPQREEYDKLFSINILPDENSIKNSNFNLLYKNLESVIQNFDLVVICDYGHGLINSKIKNLLEEKSKFLAVNCQTNSSNYGMNLISKYKCVDTFALDEREINLVYGTSDMSKNELLRRLTQQLDAKAGWLTLGAEGALSAGRDEKIFKVPALTLHVKDTVGAGDAFYAISSLCAWENMPLDLATLLANGAGAIKTHLVGNKRPIEKKELLKFINAILNV